jgi:hypothetical protein
MFVGWAQIAMFVGWAQSQTVTPVVHIDLRQVIVNNIGPIYIGTFSIYEQPK